MVYLSLDGMPLDTDEHIAAAWSLVHSPMVRGVVTAGEIALAKDRIQMAAVEHGLGFFPEPEVS